MIRRLSVALALAFAVPQFLPAKPPLLDGAQFMVMPEPFGKKRTVVLDLAVAGVLVGDETKAATKPWAEIRAGGAPIAFLYYQHPRGWVTLGELNSSTVKVQSSTTPSLPNEPSLKYFQGKLVWKLKLAPGPYRVITHSDKRTVKWKSPHGIMIPIQADGAIALEKTNQKTIPLP